MLLFAELQEQASSCEILEEYDGVDACLCTYLKEEGSRTAVDEAREGVLR